MKLFSCLISGIVLVASISSCKEQKKKSSGIPQYDHVIIVVEENHSYDALIGTENAPYINQLAKEGALFTDAHGVVHPSQPNYLALFSGGTQNVIADECLQDTLPYTTPNLAAALIRDGFTFKGFAETLPSVGFLGCANETSTLTGAHLYARKHAPWVNWQGTQKNGIPAELSQPMTAFPSDFNQLPTVAYVIPNMDNDMHNIGKPGDTAAIQRGDKWLKDNLEAYVEWAKTHNSLLILTFDEDDFKEVNHIPTIFVGAGVKPGEYKEKINHYSVLHTLEAMYDLPVEDTNTEKAITSIWAN
jgi:hypothetical protein